MRYKWRVVEKATGNFRLERRVLLFFYTTLTTADNVERVFGSVEEALEQVAWFRAEEEKRRNFDRWERQMRKRVKVGRWF